MSLLYIVIFIDHWFCMHIHTHIYIHMNYDYVCILIYYITIFVCKYAICYFMDLYGIGLNCAFINKTLFNGCPDGLFSSGPWIRTDAVVIYWCWRAIVAILLSAASHMMCKKSFRGTSSWPTTNKKHFFMTHFMTLTVFFPIPPKKGKPVEGTTSTKHFLGNFFRADCQWPCNRNRLIGGTDSIFLRPIFQA